MTTRLFVAGVAPEEGLLVMSKYPNICILLLLKFNLFLSPYDFPDVFEGKSLCKRVRISQGLPGLCVCDRPKPPVELTPI